jgi:LPXTG-motif cell wall-anchored protein
MVFSINHFSEYAIVRDAVLQDVQKTTGANHLWWILLLILLAAVFFLFLLFMKKRRKKEQKA